MNTIDCIGFDIHKKTISFCAKAQPRPWIGAMEGTLFTGWIYDRLKPLAQELKVAHPPMLKAIAAAKKKNDKVDARMIADLLRCNLLPECYMAPVAMRDLRRMLRYRNLVVRQTTRIKNRITGPLRETGTAYNKYGCMAKCTSASC
jgi:transposase